MSLSPPGDINELVLNTGTWTFLHAAAANGDDECVRLLLACPGIDVNTLSCAESTAFELACEHNRLPIVWRLLADARVEVDCGKVGDPSPANIACRRDRLEVLQLLLASGRKISWGAPSDTNYFSPHRVAARFEAARCVRLLKRITENEVRTRCEVRRELGLLGAVIADLYALIVFTCDGLLTFKVPENAVPSLALQSLKDRRFLMMASGLPMELQMLLCHRALYSLAHNIPARESDPAFMRLAAWYSSSA